jgi:signal transduction histidine kinase
LSRLQRGAINFEPQPMFLKSSILKIIEVVKDAIEKKEIEIKINIPEYSVVNADVHMLETVIRNLLSNAIKFSHKGGIIEISSSKTENKMICFEIKDYGIGMSPDLISKLFSLTENTSRKGTEGEPSTGLGLILCKEFVEKQGGKLWTESTEGQGSTFVFTLPQS